MRHITHRIRRRPAHGPAAGAAIAVTAALRWTAHLRQVTEDMRDEIDRRGGETGIDHAPHQGCAASRTVWRPVRIIDVGTSEGDPAYLLHAEGWRYYSRRYGSSRAALSYLCGYDDAGPWAARVPGGTCETVAEAARWLEPASVRKARDAGRRVLRQGDVYAIETPRRYDGAGLSVGLPAVLGYHGAEISGHEWYHRARVLLHQGSDGRRHAPLRVPFPARFVVQTTYQMGRGGRQGAAD